MNRKGPWEGYRRSPSRLPLRARYKERRLGTRQSLPVLTFSTHGAICFLKFHKMKFGNLVEI